MESKAQIVSKLKQGNKADKWQRLTLNLASKSLDFF